MNNYKRDAIHGECMSIFFDGDMWFYKKIDGKSEGKRTEIKGGVKSITYYKYGKLQYNDF